MSDRPVEPAAPAITVGMPVFNDVAFLRESLDSVLAQTFTDFALIISDDASTDGSEQICMEYAHKDARITFVQQPRNLGISRNMRFLRDQARSPYFAWVGDDDLWDQQFLERLWRSLEARPSAVVAFCTYVFIDDHGRPMGRERDFNYGAATPARRLKGFLQKSDDCFGYGLIRAAAVRDAPFPRWPWPNRDQAYNNIFPSLCHYLVEGDYVHVSGAPLYFKRVKATEALRHNRRAGSGVWELIRFTTRRFYLACYSFAAICRAGGVLLGARMLPRMFYRWFFATAGREWGAALAGKWVAR